MLKIMDQTATGFNMIFNGEQHQIDVNVLISSLIHTSTLIQESNRYLNTGKKIDVQVKAIEKGSFLVNIELIENTVDSLKDVFTKENIEVGHLIISSVVGILGIAKFAKGKKVKKLEQNETTTRIENNEGNVITINNAVFNIYDHSPLVKEAIAKNFASLSNDKAISGFEITDTNHQPLITISENEFCDLAEDVQSLTEPEQTEIVSAKLNIVRIAFDSALKWDFYYLGNKISAKIQDPDFYKLIDKGEAFAKGDTLDVELQIIKKWDESVNTFINKSYQIIKILDHIRRPEEPKLPFTND